MPPSIEAFFALLLAVPFYLNLYLSRLWDGALGRPRGDHRARAARAIRSGARARSRPSRAGSSGAGPA